MGQITLNEPITFNFNLEINPEINITADLIKLWTERRPLTNQKLKELSVRIKTFKEITWIKDHFYLLENHKYTSKTIEDPINQLGPFMLWYSLLLPGSSFIINFQVSLI